jgi:hypothetical protein
MKTILQTETSPCPYCNRDVESEIHRLIFGALEAKLVKFKNGKFYFFARLLCPYCGGTIPVVYWGRLKNGDFSLQHFHADSELLFTAFRNVQKKKSIMDIFLEDILDELIKLRSQELGKPATYGAFFNEDSVDSMRSRGKLDDTEVISDSNLN